MNKPFRLGIIGTGKVSSDRHLPAALACPGVDVTALVDTCLKRSQEVATQYGIKPKISETIADIRHDVDGVIIATPNHTHRALAVECLQTGIHTLIEKPMATSVADCEAIIEAGKQHHMVVAIGYTTRFDTTNQMMGDLIESDYFGRIRQFAYAFGTAGGWAPVSAYNLDRKCVGGGVVAVSGSHFLDRMLQWFGYPDAFEYADDSEGGPEANAVASMRFGTGQKTIKGHFRLSKTVDLKSGLVVDTDEGLVTLSEEVGAAIRLKPHRNPSITMAISPKNNSGGKRIIYQRQLENFVTACQQGKDPEVTGQQGLQSVRLIQDMYAKKQLLVCDGYNSLWEAR